MGDGVGFNPALSGVDKKDAKSSSTQSTFLNIVSESFTEAVNKLNQKLPAEVQEPKPREFSMIPNEDAIPYSGDVENPAVKESITIPEYMDGKVVAENVIEVEVAEREEDVFMLRMNEKGKMIFWYQTADAYDIPEGLTPKDVYSTIRELNGDPEHSKYPPDLVGLPKTLQITKDGQTYEVNRKESFEMKGHDYMPASRGKTTTRFLKD